MLFIEKDNFFSLFSLCLQRCFFVFFLLFSFVHFARADFSIGTLHHDGPWLEYSLDPGASASGRIRAVNLDDATGNFLLYPVDAHVNWENGAFAPQSHEHERKFVGQWISLAQKTILLSGGEKRDVSFTLRVPPGVQSGKYAGSIMMQPISGSLSGGASDLQLSTRVGARIYVSVGGSSNPYIDSPSVLLPVSSQLLVKSPVQQPSSLPSATSSGVVLLAPDFSQESLSLSPILDVSESPRIVSSTTHESPPVFQVLREQPDPQKESRALLIQYISWGGLFLVAFAVFVKFLFFLFRKKS